MRSKNARKNREVNDRTGKLITHYFLLILFYSILFHVILLPEYLVL